MSTAPGDPDAVLVTRAIAGDDVAFATLVSRHKAWVHRFIRRYVGPQDDEAYDLLQETFFAAWLALSSYRPDWPFTTWLRRIALNKCRDRSRRIAVRRFLTGQHADGDDTPDMPDPAPGPEAQVSADQQFRLLERAVATLPRSLKEPLLLTALEGLSHREAGDLLGINAKAVEMRVYRARERLKAGR